MGYRLKEMRWRKGLTQSELSRKSTVSRPTIMAIEAGEKTDVKVGTLEKLADALDCTVGEIFFADEV